MAVISVRVAVGDTATALQSEDTGGVVGSGTAVKNLDGSKTVYLGGEDVTTANGYPLPPGGEVSFDNENGDIVYGVVGTGTANVAVLRVGA